METKVEKTINNFLYDENNNVVTNDKDIKIRFLNERDGLIIERLDPIYVDKSGRQLLREQY